MRKPEDWTPEEQERFLRAIFDPSGAWGLKPDDPLPLNTRLYRAGYLDGVLTAERVMGEMMRVKPSTPPETAAELRSVLAEFVLRNMELGNMEESHPKLVEVAYANDEQTRNAVLAEGAPEWNEKLGDKYRDGHSAGFWDFLEERLSKILEQNGWQRDTNDLQ